ncbi:hypothetical protein [Glycomyces tritici]|uniref:Secreted protein n=1 Tax=Glycomyces tritici TaxID=2665176 RepID=A0ABT7YM44_9ACTN|nr:hypothetical protein [Glycomyces tritici]MDN3239692.1 hypothetical protein [Glycomyces tritici]
MTTSRAFLKRHKAIGALLVILTAAGCGTGTEPDTGAAASSPGAAATTSESASPSPEATASPAAPTTEAPEPDNADYESCGDGECEVQFSGSVEFPLEGDDGQWTVDAAVEAGGVKVDLTNPDGLGGGGGLLYEPGCTLQIRGDGGGGLSCAEAGAEPPAPEAGGFVAHLVELDGDAVTLHVALG